METLAAVREPFTAVGNVSALLPKQTSTDSRDAVIKIPYVMPEVNLGPPPRSLFESTAAYLDCLTRRGSFVEFDTALVSTPTGPHSQKVVYWVHPDNIMDVHILLMRTSNLKTWEKILDPTASSHGGSSASSRRVSLDAGASDPRNTGGKETTFLICDEIARSRFQNSPVAEGSEEMAGGQALQQAAVRVQYCHSERFLLAVDTGGEFFSKSPVNLPESRIHIAKFERRPPLHDYGGYSPEAYKLIDDFRDAKEAYQWLKDHPKTRPIAQVRSKRSQFVGLENSAKLGIYTTLNTDIKMAKCRQDALSLKDSSDLILRSKPYGDWRPFPFAVLEVRVEGECSPAHLEMLDETHLVSDCKLLNRSILRVVTDLSSA